jgi:hypothetical protein
MRNLNRPLGSGSLTAACHGAVPSSPEAGPYHSERSVRRSQAGTPSANVARVCSSSSGKTLSREEGASNGYACWRGRGFSRVGAPPSREWVHCVIALLNAAVRHLDQEPAVHSTILKAASLLQRQIDPEVAQAAPNKAGVLAWWARKGPAYIDSHITGPVLVTDLCALVRLGAAHFSRAFKRTF